MADFSMKKRDFYFKQPPKIEKWKKNTKNNRWGLEKLMFQLNCSHFPISDNSTLRYSVHRNSCFLKRVLENGLEIYNIYSQMENI